MRFFVLTAVASLLSAVSAANITVIVGKNGTLTYTPNSYDPHRGFLLFPLLWTNRWLR